MPSNGYIAYIDEAGDDGLRRIKTRDESGASEWMVLSAVVVKADREAEVLTWAKTIISAMDQHQLSHLHYAKLSVEKRLLACRIVAGLPLRVFVLLSHKKNMENYRNVRAEQSNVNRTARFYVWLSRLLLERVTEYCGRRTMHDYGEVRSVRMEFSDRGGVKPADLVAYYTYLRNQSRMGMLHNRFGDLDWRVVDLGQILTYPNRMRAGLQIADIAASAFFGGLEMTPRLTTVPEPAKALSPRVAFDKDRKVFGYGVKLMPGWLRTLPAQQAKLIDFYRRK